MLLAFWQGLGFGLTLQLSVGPVCIAVLGQSVARGFRSAFWMTLGVTVVDAAYMLASLIGVGTLMQIAVVRQGLQVAGALVLIYFGCRHLRHAGSGRTKREAAAKDSFWHGVTITMTSPLTILFWAGVFGAMIASQPQTDWGQLLFFSLGCAAATVLFLGLVSAGGGWVARFVQPSLLKRLDVGVGIFLLLFGGWMLLRYAISAIS
jgi:threonine/homoserine/homoserine lactone efflux protein